MCSQTDNNPQVLIVGAGPVGLSLAHFLHLNSIKFRIIERRLETSFYSRAFSIQTRSLEILNLMGVVEAMLTVGRKMEHIEFKAYDNGAPIFGLKMSKPNSSQPFTVGMMQSDLEKCLETKLNSLGHFIERGKQLVNLEFDAEGVVKSAKIIDSSDGIEVEEEVGFQYVVGCDGARSQVRKCANIEFKGETANLNLICCDIRLDTDIPYSEFANFFFKDDSGSIIINVKDDFVRLISPLKEGEPTPSETELFAKFKELTAPYKFEVKQVIWFNVFRINERSASTQLLKNLILCGDAAHVHSPAGGQGMNTGIQDAFNLAWKLSLQLNNLTKDDQLLETYNLERKAIAKLVLENSGKLMRNSMQKPSLPFKLLRNNIAHYIFQLDSVKNKASENFSQIKLEYETNILNVKTKLDWITSSKVNSVGLRIPYFELIDLTRNEKVNTHYFFNGTAKFQLLLIIPPSAIQLHYLYQTLDQLNTNYGLKNILDLRIVIPSLNFNWFTWFEELAGTLNEPSKLKLEKLKLLLSEFDCYLDRQGELINYFGLHNATFSGVVVRPDFHISKIFDGEFQVDELIAYFNRFLKL